LPGTLEAAILRATALVPEMRFDTLAGLMEALAPLGSAAGQPVQLPSAGVDGSHAGATSSPVDRSAESAGIVPSESDEARAPTAPSLNPGVASNEAPTEMNLPRIGTVPDDTDRIDFGDALAPTSLRLQPVPPLGAAGALQAWTTGVALAGRTSTRAWLLAIALLFVTSLGVGTVIRRLYANEATAAEAKSDHQEPSPAFRPGPPIPSRVALTQAAPPSAGPTTAPLGTPERASREVVPSPEPPRKTVPRTIRVAPATDSKRNLEARPIPASAGPAEPAQTPVGKVALASDVPLEARCGEKFLGWIPGTFELTAGPQTLRLTNIELGVARELTVKIVAGELVRERIILGKARLEVRVSPWAEVALDGRNLGMTPLPVQDVYEGAHVLELSNPGLGRSKRVDLQLRAGEHRVVRESLH
jgi:hypothetical protein